MKPSVPQSKIAPRFDRPVEYKPPSLSVLSLLLVCRLLELLPLRGGPSRSVERALTRIYRFENGIGGAISTELVFLAALKEIVGHRRRLDAGLSMGAHDVDLNDMVRVGPW